MSFRHTYSCQTLDDEDIRSVTKVLKSDYLTQGPMIDAFERELASSVDAAFSIAISSATAGLHLALAALGIGNGDWVWTTTNTFVATVNTALMRNAQVKLIDIDLDTFNIDLGKLERELEYAAVTQSLPHAIVVVHFGGSPVNMSRLGELAKRFQFKVIEDASHAYGGSFSGHPIGSCHASDVCVFSFHPVKPITTGEGGMITTNDPCLYTKMKRMRSHGIERSQKDHHPNWHYDQVSEGWNYRMTDLSAALGISQLKKSERFLEKRRVLREIYASQLDGFPIQLQRLDDSSVSSHHLCVLRFSTRHVRDRVNTHLQKEGIGTNFHYIPIYRHSFHTKLGSSEDFPNSERYYETALTVPLHVKLEDREVIDICQEILKVI